ncbi:catalase-related domain-containing protein [Nocardia sp. CA-129566]|uniref:catalase-related domain-containing protein n=1 Tax=Nocardia sp. CA-129566 TaxID=3239976 RepID=UPI003D99C5C9
MGYPDVRDRNVTKGRQPLEPQVLVLLDNAARDRLVDNIVGHLRNGVSAPVLDRAFEYRRNIANILADRVEAEVQAEQHEHDPKAAQQHNPVRSSAQHKT